MLLTHHSLPLLHNLLTQRTRLSCRQSPRLTIVKASSNNGSSVNVLVVGGGGREHALAWKLSQSPLCNALYCTPGNPGIAAEPGITTLPSLDVGKHADVLDFCKTHNIDLVVVGPEAPLVDGLADSLAAASINVFGPSASAARLEGSKAFMKDLCAKYNIPTAAYGRFSDVDAALAFVREQGAPIVVKTDGLAAGKGVIVATTLEEAEEAVRGMLIDKTFGSAGNEIVIEEFLDGEEASFFALLDGPSAIPLGSAQDHKAVWDGDTGPNTGGMGAYNPAPVVDAAMEQQIMEDIVLPTARGMVAEGCPFRGVLFAGLMIKDGKAKLLEHNVRFGDPECQGLMYRMKSDLLPVLMAACKGQLDDVTVEWKDGTALTVVMAANGYPGSYAKGTVIRDTDKVTTAKVFHAGTALNDAGELVASGGRVLGVTALEADVAKAQEAAYKGVKTIVWDDAYYRNDIGWRAVERLSVKQQ